MSITRVYDNWELATSQNYAELLSAKAKLPCKAVKLPRSRLRTVAYHYRVSDIVITIIHNNWEVNTGQNYAELSSDNYLCKAFKNSRTRRIPAYQHGPSFILITIVYDNLETSTGQNYAELRSGELELSCRALNKSRTPRQTLAYHHRTGDMVIIIILNHWAIAIYQT